MPNFRYSIIAISALVIFGAFAAPASASVAYIDGNEVWVSSDDGARKVRLSSGENDWREVAQSDQGYIVGIRREAGKVSQLASFTVWDPSGGLFKFGALSGDTGCTNAYPLSLDITPTGGNLVYGFSCYTYGYPVGTLVTGTYLKATADGSVGVPIKLTNAKYPTLVGTRVIGAVSDTEVGLQDPSSIGQNTFTGWLSVNIAERRVGRTDVSATGNLTATEAWFSSGPVAVDKIVMGKWSGLGGAYVDDCFLPIQGDARNPSLSQDGTSVTWGDARGVLIAGVPNYNGAADCQLTRAPVVISPTGSYPSYGPFNIAAAAVPSVTLPAKPKLSNAIKSGLTITVSSKTGGKAKATLTIKPSKVGKRGKKPIVLATGSVNTTAGVSAKLKLKFTRTGKKLKKKLKGKKLTLSVTVDGQTATSTIKLK